MGKLLDKERQREIERRREYMRQFAEECRMEKEVDPDTLCEKVGHLRSLTKSEKFYVTKAVKRKAMMERHARQQWDQHTWNMRHQGDVGKPFSGSLPAACSFEFAECNDEDCMCHEGATTYYQACLLEERFKDV